MDKIDRYFEVKASGGDSSGTFEGLLSVFGEEDSYSDIVVKGAFSHTLKEHRTKGRMPALLWQHDAREPIGVFREMRETDQGLFVKGELFVDDIPKAKQAYRLLKEGGLSGMSIGFKTVDSEIKANGVRLLKEIELMEGSLVTFPALDSARVMDVKSAPKDVREFESLLRDAGYSRKQSKAIIANGYKAVDQCDADDGIESSLNELYKTITGKD